MASKLLNKLRQILLETWDHFKKNVSLYWQTVLMMLLGLLLLGIIANIFIVQASKMANQALATNYAQALSIGLISQSIFLIVIFLWMIFIQGLLIHLSLQKKFAGIKELVSHFAKDYLKFLSLSIFLALVGLVVLIPFYGISLVVLFDLPYKTLLANILLIIFFVLMVNVPWLFGLVPYLMLDKHLRLFKALKENYQMVKGRAMRVLGYLIIPLIIVFVLNVFLSKIETGRDSLIVNLFSLFVIMPLIYSYLGRVYERFNQAR